MWTVFELKPVLNSLREVGLAKTLVLVIFVTSNCACHNVSKYLHGNNLDFMIVTISTNPPDFKHMNL